MTKRKAPPRAAPRPIPAATMADLDRAVDELGIDVPVLDMRLVGGRLELHLYGGQVVVWPPLPESEGMKGEEEEGGEPCLHA